MIAETIAKGKTSPALPSIGVPVPMNSCASLTSSTCSLAASPVVQRILVPLALLVEPLSHQVCLGRIQSVPVVKRIGAETCDHLTGLVECFLHFVENRKLLLNDSLGLISIPMAETLPRDVESDYSVAPTRRAESHEPLSKHHNWLALKS